jgi:rRNA-processing protein FCF1
MTPLGGGEQLEMNVPKVVIDSNIIKYLSKGILNIEEILKRVDNLYISIITYLEVMNFNFKIKRNGDY